MRNFQTFPKRNVQDVKSQSSGMDLIAFVMLHEQNDLRLAKKLSGILRVWLLCILLSATEVHDLLSTINSIAVKTPDKNTRTRALWVISKQTFPSEIVKKEVSFLTFFVAWETESHVSSCSGRNICIYVQHSLGSSCVSSGVQYYFYTGNNTY